MIEIHTRGWNGDMPLAEGEEPNASLSVRVFVDGVEILGVTRARAVFKADDFSQVYLHLVDAARVITHTDESWRNLEKGAA